jgi:hypothetical protein
MRDQNTKNITELTPATIENMPIGQKITAYEEILKDQALFTKKLEEISKKGNEVLESAGKQFVEYLQKSDIKVPKKREVDQVLADFARQIGNSISDILANSSTGETTLEEYIGKDGYEKLKTIAEEYSIQRYGSKATDEKASEKVWQDYTKVRDEYQKVREQLGDANRRMDQANQYVSYVQKLADVASKTKRLMK